MSKYNPSVPPAKDDDLLPFLDDELVRIGQTLNDVSDGYWGLTQNIPERLKPGLVKYFAAGVVGPKEGIYTYGQEEVWRYGGTIPEPPPPKPLPGDWVLLGAPATGSTQIGNCAYRVSTDKDALFITFFLQGGTLATTSTLWTLPAGVRPSLDVPFPLYVQTPIFGTALTFPPAPDPSAPPLDQIVYMLTHATAATQMAPAAYVLVKTNGVIEVTYIPNNGTAFGGTFMIPLTVTP